MYFPPFKKISQGFVNDTLAIIGDYKLLSSLCEAMYYRNPSNPAHEAIWLT